MFFPLIASRWRDCAKLSTKFATCKVHWIQVVFFHDLWRISGLSESTDFGSFPPLLSPCQDAYRIYCVDRCSFARNTSKQLDFADSKEILEWSMLWASYLTEAYFVSVSSIRVVTVCSVITFQLGKDLNNFCASCIASDYWISSTLLKLMNDTFLKS